MKKALLAGVTLAALFTTPAHALDAVTAPILETMTQMGIAKDAASWATQAADMSQSIAKATAQLQQLQALYGMMNNPVSLLGVAPQLLTGSAQSPLGTDAGAIVGLASGVGRFAGAASGLAAQVQNTNTLYMPQINGSFIAGLMAQRSNQTSAVQAQLTTLMNGMPARLFGLQQLQGEINAGGDVNRMATLQARMQSEVAIADEQARQAQLLMGLSQVQAQVEQQQLQQKSRMDSDQWAADRAAASGGLIGGGATAATVSARSSTAIPSFPAAP